MMKYTKFIIKDFKGINGKLELNLTNLPNSNIFTLVGLNESGKTSILEAISLLQKDVKKEYRHKMIHKSKKSNFNDKIYIEAHINLDQEDEERIKRYCKYNINFNLTQEINTIIIRKEYLFENSQSKDFKSLWTIPLKGKKLKGKTDVDLYKKDIDSWKKVVDYIEKNFPPILYYENFLFDFPQKIYLDEEKLQTKEEKEYRKVFQDILDSFNQGLSIEKHILERLNNNTDENIDAFEALMGDISQKLSDVILDGWDEVFKRGNKEIILKHNKDEERGWYIELQIKQGKDRFFINERSLGFRWFFSFLLFTEFRKERKEDFGEALFLLDEPASNLHQKSQQKLLGIFEKLSEKSKIIYSTHSHHLINPKYLSGTYIIKNDAINYEDEDNFNQNETKINATLYKNFVAKYPKENDHFKPILDAIDYIPSNLEKIDTIICLEGKNDYYIFKYFQEIIFENKYKFNFYPGASVSKYDDLFRLYLAWGKKIYGIFDSDSQGEKEKKRYIDNISQELEKNIFTLKNIDENWINFTTENLFTENDKIKVIKKLFPEESKYNKSKFNTSLQDVFINKKEIDLDKETIENFKKVFNFLLNKIS